MKKKDIPVEQYASMTDNIEGASEEFLDESAPLIGYIVHSFNDLEESLNSVLCQIINDRTDVPGLVVIQKLSYSAKVDLFKRFNLMEASYLKNKNPDMDKLIERLTESGMLRNQVVHANWEGAHDDGYTSCKLKVNTNGVQHEYIQYTSESLSLIRQYIDDTYSMLDEIWYE